MTPQQKALAKRARAGATSSTRPVGPVSTDIRARVLTQIEPPVGASRNRKAPRMTSTQRDSTGKRSAWAASPYYFTDSKWSSTVSEVRS